MAPRLRQLALLLCLGASLGGLVHLLRQRQRERAQLQQSPAVRAQAAFRERLRVLRPAPDGIPLILVLGSSVLQAALGDLRQLGARVDQERRGASGGKGGAVAVDGVLLPALDLELVADDLGRLLRLRPALLLVEVDLLWPNLPLKRRMRRLTLRDWVWQRWRERPAPAEERTANDRRDTEETFAGAEIDRVGSLAAGAGLLRAAVAEGIPVILVEIPASPTGRSLGAAGLLQRRAEAAAALCADRGGASFLRLGLDLFDEDYADYRHLNAAGVRRFTAALAPHLAAALDRSP